MMNQHLDQKYSEKYFQILLDLESLSCDQAFFILGAAHEVQLNKMQKPLNFYIVESLDKDILIKMLTFYKPIGSLYQDDIDKKFKGFWISESQFSQYDNVDIQLVYDSFDHMAEVEKHWTFNAKTQCDYKFYLLQ